MTSRHRYRLPDPGSRHPSERRAHLRSPRLGRLAHARRQAPVRVDDPALRQVALQRLAGQPAQEGPVGRHARGVRHRRHLHGAAQVRSRRRLPALLKVLRAKKADIVHLHGYGATTFGRMCAWRMGIPAILHEHANHGDTPWFQKVADRPLAPYTDIAIAVSESTGEFTTRARLMPAERTKVVYLGAPLDEFARAAQRRRDRGGARSDWASRRARSPSARSRG